MMTPDLTGLAKQGDAIAIATLLNQALQKQDITVKGSLQENRLRLLLEGTQVPDPGDVMPLIEQNLQQLQPQSIQIVQVYGRQISTAKPTWQREFSLEVMPTSDGTKTHLVPAKQLHTSKQQGNLAKIAVQPNPVKPALHPKRIQLAGWRSLAIGLAVAIALFISPLKIVFYGFLILVHEVGHAVTHWLFGRPAIPTVNLLFGGGVTLVFDQSKLLIVAIYLGVAFLTYWVRSYPRIQGIVVALTILYTYCLLTPTNTMLSTFMGHGMEIGAIAVCLYLSASGYFCRFAGDRSIYAMLGFFTLLNNIQFSWQLTHDEDFLGWYLGGIGGAIDNDLVILANEYFGVSLFAIANFFLVCCILTPIVAFLALRYEQWLVCGINKLLVRH